MTKTDMPQDIAAALAGFRADLRKPLLAVRQLIFDLSREIEPKVRIEESLKWGQPSYVPVPKTGTPIRLGTTKDDRAAIFVHCQTTLISGLAADNPHGLITRDNRTVVLPPDPAANVGLRGFVRSALQYHMDQH